jgi:hypothetical protein
VALEVFAEQAPGSLTIQAKIGLEPLELHVIGAAIAASMTYLRRDLVSALYASAAALDKVIINMAASLDNAQIVGGRFDVVGHSMGGLVARYYATTTAGIPSLPYILWTLGGNCDPTDTLQLCLYKFNIPLAPSGTDLPLGHHGLPTAELLDLFRQHTQALQVPINIRF